FGDSYWWPISRVGWRGAGPDRAEGLAVDSMDKRDLDRRDDVVAAVPAQSGALLAEAEGWSSGCGCGWSSWSGGDGGAGHCGAGRSSLLGRPGQQTGPTRDGGCPALGSGPGGRHTTATASISTRRPVPESATTW